MAIINLFTELVDLEFGGIAATSKEVGATRIVISF